MLSGWIRNLNALLEELWALWLLGQGCESLTLRLRLKLLSSAHLGITIVVCRDKFEAGGQYISSRCVRGRCRGRVE